MPRTHASDWFAHQVLQWFDRNGRKHLPWQASRDPYAIWLSEIMLQQTQVPTAIPYFTSFLARFPTLQDLAEAPLDDVLHLWAGLGYYARARNLHRAAQQVISQYGGRMPGTVEELLTLPGIGRSTAGAIAAMAFGQPAAILDGNVKRVLARFHAIEGWPGQAPVARQLWAWAESHLPKTRVADYTQAIMDLGALVCRRSSPDCPACPLRSRCKAHGTGQADRFPGRKPARALPVRCLTFFILCRRGGEVLLQRRPAQGIWGGLWSFPEADRHVHELPQALVERLGPAEHLRPWAIERHTLSHFHMDILPLLGVLDSPPALVMEPGDWLWYSWVQPAPVGLAAPVQRLLAKLHSGLPDSSM
ncbi:MAG: A/G-specific adenine glycosylase [Pseudomonadota bacterium]|jgi:A/G-specific adenine glycosylase